MPPLTTFAPALFVLLWSTGFIGAKLGLPYAEPFTFLALRFSILAAILTLAAIIMKAEWPKSPQEAGRTALTGVLVQGCYLGGVFAAISLGVPAGISALIVGAQPLLTAIAAGPFLGERITSRQWIGFVIGFTGLVLVVERKLSWNPDHINGVLLCLVALLGITAGTLYQKRHGQAMDMRSGSAIQFAAAAIPMLVLALAFESMEIQWTGEFVFALSWLVLILSLGAMTVLYYLIRKGAASKVASLFYLVPPVVALEAYFLFGETLGPLALAGMALTVVGVALVTKS